MKMMQGACFLPCSNRSRTREAPTPTNISTKSEPLMEKNGTLASPAMARASNVLHVRVVELLDQIPSGLRRNDDSKLGGIGQLALGLAGGKLDAFYLFVLYVFIEFCEGYVLDAGILELTIKVPQQDENKYN